MNFLDLKARTRRSVHSAFAVPCVLARGERDGSSDFPLTARFHDKIAMGGDIAGQGYAGIIEGIQCVIFNREELAVGGYLGAPLTLARGDMITFPNYNGTGQDVIVVLDIRNPYDGPIDEKWTVAPP